MWREMIELGNQEENIEHGEPVKTWLWRKVFANKKSVRQTEFYQAANVGLRPELIFEVYSFEFNNDERVRYNGKEYTIIRSYEKGETTELTITSYTGREV